jgi:CRP-like cAMP-binding protein
MKSNKHLDNEESELFQKTKELLEIPPSKREDKTCLEIMNLTKNLKIFENISRSIEHQNICNSLKLEIYKPNEIIIKQGDKGECLYHILHGVVSIQLSITIDTGIQDKSQVVNVQKNMGELTDGDFFGELALIYNIPRTATITALTETTLIRIDRHPFNRYLKHLFEGQLEDQIEFMQLCPIFSKMPKNLLINLGIRANVKKFATGQIILKNESKCDSIYIIRRGTVKVSKEISFIKNENKIKKRRLKKNSSQILTFEEYKNRKELEKEKMKEILSFGPNEQDLKEDNYIKKEITLEILKIGDIFPSYYACNELYLDVQFESDNPCELIEIDISNIKEIIPETYNFIKKYSRPYPNEQFLRRFHYFNESWLKYKKEVKCEIIADSLNKKSIKRNNMRMKIYKNNDIKNIQLPMIFNFKNQNMKFK